MSDAQAPTQTGSTRGESHVSEHRWPWDREEFLCMALSFGLPGALAALSWPNLIWAAAWTLSATAGIYWLYRVGKHRKTKSSVRIEISAQDVQITSDGTLGKSRVNLAAITSVGYRRFGSDECFMLSSGTECARIPVRATVDPHVAVLIDQAFAQAAEIAPDALDLNTRRPAV